MSLSVAMAFLIAYYLMNIEIYLATYTVGVFKLSYGIWGPTELRVLLAIGNIAMMFKPHVTIAGHRFLLADVGAAVAIPFIVAVSRSSARCAIPPALRRRTSGWETFQLAALPDQDASCTLTAAHLLMGHPLPSGEGLNRTPVWTETAIPPYSLDSIRVSIHNHNPRVYVSSPSNWTASPVNYSRTAPG